MTTKPLYQVLSQSIQAWQNCQLHGNTEWFQRHEDKIAELVKEHMPSGSGFDSGTTLDLNLSHQNLLVFRTSYHHMNPHGFYDGWTDHIVRVRPDLQHQINLAITGRDRNQIKDYIHDVFHTALMREIP